jgi:large subunit ribosomal protein L5
MDVIITTTAKTDEEGRALLKFLGLPFRKENKDQNAAPTAA